MAELTEQEIDEAITLLRNPRLFKHFEDEVYEALAVVMMAAERYADLID